MFQDYRPEKAEKILSFILLWSQILIFEMKGLSGWKFKNRFFRIELSELLTKPNRNSEKEPNKKKFFFLKCIFNNFKLE